MFRTSFFKSIFKAPSSQVLLHVTAPEYGLTAFCHDTEFPARERLTFSSARSTIMRGSWVETMGKTALKLSLIPWAAYALQLFFRPG
ncbi:MAG TPA: hypothetical protein VGP72_17700 [Planctomycetota bacterium]|jgi:hypothetical protein